MQYNVAFEELSGISRRFHELNLNKVMKMTTINIFEFKADNWTVQANKVTAPKVNGIYQVKAIKDSQVKAYDEFNLHFPERDGTVEFQAKELPLVTYFIRSDDYSWSYKAKSGSISVNNNAETVSGVFTLVMELLPDSDEGRGPTLTITNGQFSFTK